MTTPQFTYVYNNNHLHAIHFMPLKSFDLQALDFQALNVKSTHRAQSSIYQFATKGFPIPRAV
jgi:hypothetical protein